MTLALWLSAAESATVYCFTFIIALDATDPKSRRGHVIRSFHAATSEIRALPAVPRVSLCARSARNPNFQFAPQFRMLSVTTSEA